METVVDLYNIGLEFLSHNRQQEARAIYKGALAVVALVTDEASKNATGTIPVIIKVLESNKLVSDARKLLSSCLPSL